MAKKKKTKLFFSAAAFFIAVCLGSYFLWSGSTKGAYNPAEPHTVGSPQAVQFTVSDQEDVSKPATKPTKAPIPGTTPRPVSLTLTNNSVMPLITEAGSVPFLSCTGYPSNFDLSNYTELEVKVIAYTGDDGTSPILDYSGLADGNTSKICLNSTLANSTIYNGGYGNGYITKYLDANNAGNYTIDEATGEVTIKYDLTSLRIGEIPNCISAQTKAGAGTLIKSIKIVSITLMGVESATESGEKVLPEIPVSVGGRETKGTRENPFVILEVVSNKALQSMTYLNTGDEPYDFVKLTTQVNMLDNNGNLNSNVLTNQLQFYFNRNYSTYNPSSKKMESISIARLDKLYDIKTPAASLSDPAFNGVRDIIRNDTKNWSKKADSTITASGYLLLKLSGQGDYSVNLSTKTVTYPQNTGERYWVYYKDKSELPADATPFTPKDVNDLNNNYIGKRVSNVYMEIKDWKIPTFQWIYYAITNNDILKHSLFRFETEEDYKNFHMKIIAVTPDEINEMMKYDTEETLDYIERADLFYLSDMSSNSDTQIQEAVNFYYKYVLEKPTVNIASIATYAGNDIEWDACMKLLYRLGEDRNLPLLINSYTYKLGTQYNTHVYKYMDQNNVAQCRDTGESTIINVGKVFHIVSQFDLHARRLDGGGYGGTRTFMEDIFPKIQKVKLRESNGTAEYTGYYDREQCPCKNKSKKEQNTYLWSEYTFFPTGNNLSDSDSRLQSQYGYLGGFRFNNNQANFSGTLGNDGQNIVGLGVNKSLIQTSYYASTTSALYEILAGLFNRAKALTVKVDKSFKNGSDYLYYLDINEKATYGANDAIEIPFTVQNSNNMNGTVTINAVDPDTGNTVALKVKEQSDTAISIPKEATTKFTLEYPVKHWKRTSGNRYVQISISGSVKRSYMGADGKSRETPVARTQYTLDLLERELFDLD